MAGARRPPLSCARQFAASRTMQAPGDGGEESGYTAGGASRGGTCPERAGTDGGESKASTLYSKGGSGPSGVRGAVSPPQEPDQPPPASPPLGGGGDEGTRDWA